MSKETFNMREEMSSKGRSIGASFSKLQDLAKEELREEPKNLEAEGPIELIKPPLDKKIDPKDQAKIDKDITEENSERKLREDIRSSLKRNDKGILVPEQGVEYNKNQISVIVDTWSWAKEGSYEKQEYGKILRAYEKRTGEDPLK